MTIDDIRVEVSRIGKAEGILRCWERMYSEPVALARFKAFVFVAHGILPSLADEEQLTKYQIEAAASIIAGMYLDHNEIPTFIAPSAATVTVTVTEYLFYQHTLLQNTLALQGQ